MFTNRQESELARRQFEVNGGYAGANRIVRPASEAGPSQRCDDEAQEGGGCFQGSGVLTGDYVASM